MRIGACNRPLTPLINGLAPNGSDICAASFGTFAITVDNLGFLFANEESEGEYIGPPTITSVSDKPITTCIGLERVCCSTRNLESDCLWFRLSGMLP